MVKKAKRMFFPQNNRSEFNPRRGGNSNAMDTSASLSKATTKANKERYKREGRCFFCEAQGHVSHGCPKKPLSPPMKTNQAKIVATTTMEETTTMEPNNMTLTFNQELVLNYLKELSSNKYQQMAEVWGKMSMGEDFGQA